MMDVTFGIEISIHAPREGGDCWVCYYIFDK